MNNSLNFHLRFNFSSLDPTATHFLLRHLQSSESSVSIPIGTIRGTKHIKASADGSGSSTYYKLSRLAILKSYRKYKLGRKLVETLHSWIISDAKDSSYSDDTVKVITHSQIPVKGFYAKFGYIPESLLETLSDHWDIGTLDTGIPRSGRGMRIRLHRCELQARRIGVQVLAL
ncbi:hypothetical protein D9758_004857 [Tetrapyrgos nigripes]|uniref:N-acetyltransferase domain-containing protein n=1 Tax=Tetrapyrgos nigripes TaxID=182062 RepID=A0A8H5G683_9AGAR|nr:hypothetical protein D9758_004857 [Tetrapyrgos nigripes]